MVVSTRYENVSASSVLYWATAQYSYSFGLQQELEDIHLFMLILAGVDHCGCFTRLEHLVDIPLFEQVSRTNTKSP